MRALVVGGTGFIGSCLATRLAGSGWHVTVPVRQARKPQNQARGLVEDLIVDLLDQTSVYDLVRDNDVVFHLASIRGRGWSFDDKTVNAVNVGITRNLLNASARKENVRLIYVSSASVYGHPVGGPIGEGFPCVPVTRYGCSKYTSEKLVANYHENGKIQAVIVRPVITYGPGDFGGMIPKLISLIKTRRFLTVGSGLNRVHLIYIDDLVDGLLLAYEKADARRLKIYNLAGNEPITINRLVTITEKALCKKVPRLHIPLPVAKIAAVLLETFFRIFFIKREPFLTRDKLDIMCRDRVFSIRKARDELGFMPRVGYEEGIGKAVKWLFRLPLL